jgi:hypothetical protein
MLLSPEAQQKKEEAGIDCSQPPTIVATEYTQTTSRLVKLHEG